MSDTNPLPLIGRERALLNRLVKDLRQRCGYATRGLGDGPRGRLDAYEQPRGGVFELLVPGDAGDRDRTYRVEVALLPPADDTHNPQRR